MHLLLMFSPFHPPRCTKGIVWILHLLIVSYSVDFQSAHHRSEQIFLFCIVHEPSVQHCILISACAFFVNLLRVVDTWKIVQFVSWDFRELRVVF